MTFFLFSEKSMSPPPVPDGTKPKQKGGSPNGKPPDHPFLSGTDQHTNLFRLGRTAGIRMPRTINTKASTKMPTLTSTCRFSRHRHSKRKADTARAVSARIARATRKAPTQKAVVHGVWVRLLHVAVIIAVSSLPFRISSACPGLYILYPFFADLSIGRLPVILSDFQSFFGCFSQKEDVAMQFLNFNPAKSAQNGAVSAIFRQVLPFIDSFSHRRQNPRTNFRNRHRMIAEGQQRSATGTGGRRTAQSDAPPFNFER